jgi:transcriptional regulator with XRE-family HTH domain
MIRIKELRLERNMYQADLAKELGVSQNSLSYWESGKYEPDSEMLGKIADYFDVSVDYLLGRTNYRQPAESIAMNSDIPYDELSPEAVRQIKDYINFIKEQHKHKNK